MLEARIVAARIHGAVPGVHGKAQGAARMTPASDGGAENPVIARHRAAYADDVPAYALDGRGDWDKFIAELLERAFWLSPRAHGAVPSRWLSFDAYGCRSEQMTVILMHMVVILSAAKNLRLLNSSCIAKSISLGLCCLE
jgi:hypothetical protein